jgi:phosphatidylglycerophosphate synthase
VEKILLAVLSSKYREQAGALINPAAKALASFGFKPNLLTQLGLASSILTGVTLALGMPWAAFLSLLLTAFLDVMDGAVARITGENTAFGGFLDAVFDRYSDAAILIGIAVYLHGHYILVFIVLLGSLMVSYTRSKAEKYLQRCDVGIAERAERLILLIAASLIEALGFLAHGRAFLVALVILAFLTHFTVLQRALYTRSRL